MPKLAKGSNKRKAKSAMAGRARSTILDALKEGVDIYICSGCAEANGAVWPKDHVATFHSDACAECGKTRALCALSDWEWPGRAGRRMRERRET